MMKNKTLLGIIFAIAGGIFWGFSGTCGEFVFKNYDVSSTWLCSVRILLAGLILLGISFIKYRPQLFAMFKNKRVKFAADKTPPQHPPQTGEGITGPLRISRQIFFCIDIINHILT